MSKLSIVKIPVQQGPYEQGDRCIRYNGCNWITLSKEFWAQVKSDKFTYDYLVNELKRAEKLIQ